VPDVVKSNAAAWVGTKSEHTKPGEAVTGAAGLRRCLLRGGAPARRPAARSATPDRHARGTRRNDSTSWRVRTASGTSTSTTRGCRPVPRVYGSGRPAFSPPTVLRGRGRSPVHPVSMATAKARGSTRGQGPTPTRSRTDARRWAEGEGGHHPSPSGQRWMSPRTCQERFASLRDGLRPHLTEPLRRSVRSTCDSERVTAVTRRLETLRTGMTTRATSG
jgi:hypothetical protein